MNGLLQQVSELVGVVSDRYSTNPRERFLQDGLAGFLEAERLKASFIELRHLLFQHLLVLLYQIVDGDLLGVVRIDLAKIRLFGSIGSLGAICLFGHGYDESVPLGVPKMCRRKKRALTLCVNNTR